MDDSHRRRYSDRSGKHGGIGASEVDLLKALLDGGADAGVGGSPAWAEGGQSARGCRPKRWRPFPQRPTHDRPFSVRQRGGVPYVPANPVLELTFTATDAVGVRLPSVGTAVKKERHEGTALSRVFWCS